jgi:hypothetical protein
MSFIFKPAVREQVGLLIGMIGGTGSGKTFSALRLASGMAGDQRFAFIDTEAGRAKHYADQFSFDHGDLQPPFRPETYVDAIVAADKAGYPVIVVDSMSHVWAGDGGVLDWQEEELDRMAGNDWKKREGCKMASWIKPKMEHKKMVQKLLQVRAHMIMCFRAEEKIEMVKEDGKTKIVPKVTPTGLDGWVPICEKNLPFELTASFLLLATKPGIPNPIKLQQQHRELIDLSKPVSEDTGRVFANWANGAPSVDHSEEIRKQLKAANISEADFLSAARRQSLSQITDLQKAFAWISRNSRASQTLPQPEMVGANPAPQALSYEEVSAKIKRADSLDVLEIAGDFIRMVADEGERKKLREEYDDQMQKFEFPPTGSD